MLTFRSFLYIAGRQIEVSGRNFTIATLALSISGCATFKQPPSVTEIKIPVRVSCVEVGPVKPAFKTDAELKALDDYRLTLSLLKDRIDRQIYEGELEAVLEGCR